ncbi:MAG: TonB-dependent receptor [Bacteroidota bacterium]
MISKINIRNVIIIFLAVFFVYPIAVAQGVQKDPGDEKITVKESNITLSELLDIMDSKSEYDVSYGNYVISLSDKYNFTYHSKTVFNILDDISKKLNVSYKVSGFNITVIKKRKSSLFKKKVTISGYIKERGSEELLIGANIHIKGTNIGTVSNSYGFYSLTIPAQKAVLGVSYVGFDTFELEKDFFEDIEFDIELEQNNMLQNIDLTYSSSKRIADKAYMNVVSIQPKEVEKIPALLGEKDVFKALQYMPGVRSGSEATAGLYVRGGGPDQNLIILDDAQVYNAMHLFGFFSVFNGNAVKNVDMYKGGFPARFGGRLSSVIDISMKDGNKNDFEGQGSIGLLSSNIMVEGPIKEGKSSFIVSGRRTYIDVLAAPFTRGPGSAGYYFYDFSAKFNYEFSSKDKLFVSGYFGRDKLRMIEGGELFKMYWQNATTTLRWNHLFNSKLFSNTSLIFSDYDLVMKEEEEYGNEIYLSKYNSGIRDIGVKTDFNWMPNSDHFVRFGFNVINHYFSPSVYNIENYNQENIVQAKHINTIESSIYAEDDWKIGDRIKLNAGLRLSNLMHEGENYLSLEPRILAAFMLTDKTSLKASYSEMNQYVHLLSSTGSGMPTDIWVPATNKVAPQFSRQYAIGLANDIEKYGLTLSVEGYYKTMENIISYKEGTDFLYVSEPYPGEEFEYEDAVVVGNGYSKGVEFLLQKNQGKFSGWIGYTLSYTKHKFEELNRGKEFFPRHDRRHDISIVGIYELTPRIDFSATWVYGTGDAFTLATEEYNVYDHDPTEPIEYDVDYYPETGNIYVDGGPEKYTVNHYVEKNSFRMAAYHRLDFAFRFHKTLKSGRKRTWEFGIYNVYNRKNPFYYESSWVNEGGKKQNVLLQYSIFQIIPSVSYTLKF